MKLAIAIFAAFALVATPAAAKQRTSIVALPADVVANNHVAAVEVEVVEDALKNFDTHEAKAAEKRTAKKLTAFDPASAERPKEDDYGTLPFKTMFPLVMEDVTREWGLTGGQPVKLYVRINQLQTANAGMAMLIGSSDTMSGVVTVQDPATNAELGSFYINVVNSHSGWGGMLMRGGSIREKLAEEFALETSRMLTGRKKKGKVKTASN